MTISTSTRTAGPFTGTGALVSYPFVFKVFQTSDVLVLQTDTALVQTTLALGANYTVILNSDQNTSPGGTVTPLTALPAGYLLNISSAVSSTQPASLTNAGGFFPKTIEDALDRLTILLQQFQIFNSLGQTLRVTDIGGVGALPSAGTRANKILSFDSTGAPALTSVPTTGLVTTVISDTGAFLTQLLTTAGSGIHRVFNQAGARIVEMIGLGSAATPVYGIAAGMAGINTPAGVDLSLGVADSALMRISSALGLVGFGQQPVAGKGMLQLVGSASGGVNLGNVANTDGTTLDWYEEGTFTPQLQFGGAHVGMVNAGNVGKFTRVGNVVTFEAIVGYTTSNLGSSTGVATIAGLPYAANAALNVACAVNMSQLISALVGVPAAFVSFNGTTIQLFDSQPSGSNTALTNAKFSSAVPATISVAGSYLI